MYGAFTEVGTAIGGPWGTVVGAVADIATGLLSLFGFREEPYHDFREKIEPILKRQAASTGKTVFCYWYGEILGITPQGQMVSLGRVSPSSEGNLDLALSEAEQIITRAAQEAHETVYFYKYGRMVEITPPQAGGLTTGGISPLLIVGAALLLLKKFF